MKTDDPHPWYGPCDSFGPFQTCSECNKATKPAYRVEINDSKVCERCGVGGFWDVIGPTNIAMGRSFSCKEDAEEWAEELSMAYRMGQRAK